MGILRELADKEDPRPVRLFYGNRTLEQMAFMDEFEVLKQKLDLSVALALEKPTEGFDGYTGFIDGELLGSLVNNSGYYNWDYYICGPKPMVLAVENVLETLEIPRDRILYEKLGF